MKQSQSEGGRYVQFGTTEVQVADSATEHLVAQLRQRIAELEAEHDANETWLVQHLTRVSNERDSARRVAAARLRAVKRMKRIASEWHKRFDNGSYIIHHEGRRP